MLIFVAVAGALVVGSSSEQIIWLAAVTLILSSIGCNKHYIHTHSFKYFVNRRPYPHTSRHVFCSEVRQGAGRDGGEGRVC